MCSRDWRERERNEQTQQAGDLGMLEQEKGRKGINHIRRSWGSMGSQGCQGIKRAGSARRKVGPNWSKHFTPQVWATTLRFCGSGDRTWDLKMQIYSLTYHKATAYLRKSEQSHQKLPLLFYPTLLSRDWTQGLCAFYTGTLPTKPHPPDLWILLINTVLH